MIDYVFQQISMLERDQDKVASGGHSKKLDSLTKGRIVLKFMNQRSTPFTNRVFQTKVT